MYILSFFFFFFFDDDDDDHVKQFYLLMQYYGILSLQDVCVFNRNCFIHICVAKKMKDRTQEKKEKKNTRIVCSAFKNLSFI
jgi:hypothetical protein